MNSKKNIFARKRADGNYDILHSDSGEHVTMLNYPNIYSINSSNSLCYDNPEGIILSYQDVICIKIEIEK